LNFEYYYNFFALLRSLESIIIVIILSGLGLTSGFAQNKPTYDLPKKVTFGDIPDSLLSSDFYAEYPDAPFYYAHKGVTININEKNQSIVAELSYVVRIKILTEEGQQGAEVGIPYYFDQNIEHISNIRGITYNQDGSKTALDTANIVTVNLNNRYNVKRFLMPDARPGAVLEYAYTIERRFIEELPDFQLSHPVPTAFAQVTLNNPKFLRYEVVSDGIEQKVKYQQNFISIDSVKKIFTIKQPEPMLQEVWAVENVPPILRNEMAGSYNEQSARLKFQLSEFGRPRQPLEISWDYVVASMRRRLNPWENLVQYPKLDSLGKEIASEFDNKVAAQDSIFRYLNSAMRFNESNGSFTDNDLYKVLDGEFSSRAAINLTLLGLLRGAGIDAWPLFLSSRNFGEINRDFPSIFQFNTLLIYSEIDGTPYFMDASYSHGSIGLIPTESYNESGLVFKKEGFKWVEINPEKSKFYINLDIDADIDPRGTLAGVVKAVNEGYTAREVRKMYEQGMEVEEIVKQAFFDIYNNAEIRNAEITIDPSTGTVTMQGEFIISEYAITFQSGIEYRPLISGFLLDNPLDESSQNMTVRLDAPEFLMLNYNIEYPSGYFLKQVSQDRKIIFPGAEFHEEYETFKNGVTYSYNIEISKRTFPPDVFPQILNLYERWVNLSKSTWYIEKR